jgi:hypothetical protein
MGSYRSTKFYLTLETNLVEFMLNDDFDLSSMVMLEP